MKIYNIKLTIILVSCFVFSFLKGQNNLLVTDLGINQGYTYKWEWKTFSFRLIAHNDFENKRFYTRNSTYHLPEFPSLFQFENWKKLPIINYFNYTKPVNPDDIMNEITIKIANHYKSNTGNFELRLVHDMNSLSYGVGNIGYQQWSEKYRWRQRF